MVGTVATSNRRAPANRDGGTVLFVMKLLPILFVAALLVLVVAFGLHCLVLHCDHPKSKPVKTAGTKSGPS